MYRPDPQDGFTADDDYEYDCWNEADDDSDWYDDEYDGQPDEYTEWQDYMGGDDWDHGQYDCEDW